MGRGKEMRKRLGRSDLTCLHSMPEGPIPGEEFEEFGAADHRLTIRYPRYRERCRED